MQGSRAHATRDTISCSHALQLLSCTSPVFLLPWHANYKMTFIFSSIKMCILKKGQVIKPLCPFVAEMKQEHTHKTITYTVSLINPLVLFCVPVCGVKSLHASLFGFPSPATFIVLAFLRFLNISSSKQSRGTGTLTKKYRKTYCRVEAMQKRLGPRRLSSLCQLGAAPLGRRDAINPRGELFICLFNSIILAEWHYCATADAQIYPPRWMLCVYVCW